MPHFTSLSLAAFEDENLSASETGVVLPGGAYSHVAYVKVYATCRLRRIWFSEGGPSKKFPWEFELYGDDV